MAHARSRVTSIELGRIARPRAAAVVRQPSHVRDPRLREPDAVVPDRRWPSTERTCQGCREQERSPADHRVLSAHRSAGDTDERPGHPRRGDDAGADRRHRRRRRARWPRRAPHPRGRDAPARARRGPLPADPRLDPVGRTAPRPLRSGRRPAAGRRRDRTAADRHAHPRLPAARCRRADRSTLRHGGSGSSRDRHLPRRGIRDRNRERGRWQPSSRGGTP